MSANLVGWALIGTPDGMQAKSYGCIANFDVGRLVDINNVIIKPFPNSEIVCLLRENRNNSFINYYILYNYAKEIKTDRSGTFYGSVLVIVNNTIKGSIALQTLKEMSNYLSNYLTVDQRFTTQLSKIDLPTPSSINNVINSLQPISQPINVGNAEGIIPINIKQSDSLSVFFDFASKPLLAKTFCRLYGSSNAEVLSYVKERGKINFIDPSKIELELDVAQLRNETESLKSCLHEATSEKEALEKKATLKIETLEETLQSRESTILSLQEKVAMSEDAEKLLNKIGELESELRKAKDRSDNLGNRLQSERNDYVRTIENLREEIKIFRKANSNTPHSKQVHADEVGPKKRKSHSKNKKKNLDYLAAAILDKPLILIIIFGVIFLMLYLILTLSGIL